MKWLITYQQWTGRREKLANTAIATHPVDWLIETIRAIPEYDTVLISSIEITEEQYKKIRGE
jgi:hypothetical protein